MSENNIQIGQILIQQGVLSEQQVFEITVAQKKNDAIPFGVLAERMFDVTSQTIEQAWIEQYHRFVGTINLEDQQMDTQALSLINCRQAWQFEVLPLRTFIYPGSLLKGGVIDGDGLVAIEGLPPTQYCTQLPWFLSLLLSSTVFFYTHCSWLLPSALPPTWASNYR